jgi:hypothetical protein
LDEEYYREVALVDPNNLNISLTPIDSVYYLTGMTHFSCFALTEGLTFYNVRVFVDTTEITTYTNKMNNFYLDCKDYTDGEHILNIILVTNSTSGSLADMLGAEGFIHHLSWKLVVDKSTPTPVQITRIFNDGGIVKIEWEKYPKINFGCYKVVKTVKSESGFTSTNVVEVVTDRNKTYFFDSTFVGGWSEYVVRVESPIFKAASSEKMVYSDEYPEFKAEWKYDNHVELSWNRCKYPKAFVKYMLYINNQSPTDILDLNTTTMSGNFGILSQESSFDLKVISRNAMVDNGHVYNLNSTVTSIVGEEFIEFSGAMKNQANGNIFFRDATKLYKYNPLLGRIETIMLHPTYLPEYVLSPNCDKLFFGSNTKYINPTTFMIITVPAFHNLISNLSLTNYGIGRVSGSLAMYDYNNFVQGISLHLTGFNDLSLSEDDRYIFDFDAYHETLDCYEIINGILTKIWTLPAIEYKLIPGQPDKIIVKNSTSADIRNVSSNQVIISIPAAKHFLEDVYSPQKLLLLYDYSSDNLEFYNYETGVKLKTIHGRGANYYYSENTLFSSYGFKIPISW